MIQRIQTLYLLIVTALVTVTLFTRLAWFGGSGEEFSLYAFALKGADGEELYSAVYLGILLVLAAVLPLVTVFLYRKRMLQIRLCVVEMVLLLGSALMEGIYYYLGCRVVAELSQSAHGMQATIVLPVVGLLFAWLSVRAIFRDELLVRSTDRIR